MLKNNVIYLSIYGRDSYRGTNDGESERWKWVKLVMKFYQMLYIIGYICFGEEMKWEERREVGKFLFQLQIDKGMGSILNII